MDILLWEMGKERTRIFLVKKAVVYYRGKIRIQMLGRETREACMV